MFYMFIEFFYLLDLYLVFFIQMYVIGGIFQCFFFVNEMFSYVSELFIVLVNGIFDVIICGFDGCRESIDIVGCCGKYFCVRIEVMFFV